MVNHAARDHATWSASATTRNWSCAGALTLSSQVAHLDKESEAAGWGTAAHQVAEWCLRDGHDAVEMIGRIQKTKEQEFEVDEEMAETAQVYVDYVRKRHAGINVLYIEQKFSLQSLNPPFDAGGTADAVIYFHAEQLLEVIDLKGGRGVKVNVTENKQLRTYALGALLANPGLPVKRIRSTIVQPRMSHPDGVIRSEEYDVGELVEWTGSLLVKMAESAAAGAAYGKITGDVTREEWGDMWLKPGDHCKDTFCPARGFCPAREKDAIAKAELYFDDLDKPKLRNTPADLSPERLAKFLDAADDVTDFFNACRALAHSLAESGVEIPNYMLVEKTGRRRWTISEEDLVPKLKEVGLSEDEIYAPPKPKTPAQTEKVLGAKRKALVANLIETPVTGSNLVRADKTTRQAKQPAVHQHFDIIE